MTSKIDFHHGVKRLAAAGMVVSAFSALLCVLFVSISCGDSASGQSGDVDSLKSSLQADGFFLQAGKLEFLDIFAMVEAGAMDNANYQNAGAPYLLPRLPMGPGQTVPGIISDASINPANAGLTVDYRLRPDEAIVMVGKTPPKCTYFSFDASVVSRWNPKTGKPLMVFGNYGDPLNPLVIRTDGPEDDPYARNTMIIMAADKGVADTIRAKAVDAGFSADIINDYPIPSQVVRLGLDGKSDTLTLLLRFAYPEDAQAGQDYMDNVPMQVFRVTPDTELEPDPFEMPASRVRGTGDYAEFELSDTAEQLRQAILAKYPSMAATEMTTAPFLDGGADGLDGLVGLQRMARLYGPGRDALYLGTDEFTLADDPNEFVIVYGINHAALGKTTYNSFSVYGTAQNNGVASAWDGMYAGTAEEYLPGNPDAKYFYVWKIARRANGDQQTTEVPFNQGINGIDLTQPMIVGFRLYMAPETQTGPIAYETFFDRAIKFSGAATS